MKYILLIISFLLVKSGFSQRYHNKDYGIILGITYQPSWYNLYNENDWTNVDERADSDFEFLSEPNNPKGFNAHSIGLTIGIPLTEEFVIQTDFLYSSQSQYHKGTPFYTNTFDSNSEVYFKTEIKNNLSMLRIPLMLKYRYELGESNVFLSGLIGIQFSYTIGYHAEHFNYRELVNYDSANNIYWKKVDTDSINIYNSFKPDESTYKIWSNDGAIIKEGNSNNSPQFSDINWGGVIGAELSALVANSILISGGARFEYDFTDAASEHSSSLVFPSYTYGKTRAKSHHMRYGLTFSVAYVF